MPAPLHLRGAVLPEGERHDVWIRDGRLTGERVPGAETVATDGWILPGLADFHGHIGLDADWQLELLTT